MKILGVYEMVIGESEPIKFLITENMVNQDKERIYRCFDLKGSLYGRLEKITDEEMMQGTGLKVLKDQNLISINKMEMERGKDRAFELHTEARVLLLG